MGRVFGEPGLVVRLKADLRPLRLAVYRFLSVCEKFGIHGNLLKDGEEFEEVKRLSRGFIPKGISKVGLTAVRVKPVQTDHGHDTYWMHSDVWAGEPSGVILMFPICGDFETGGVEFFRPTRGEIEWFQPYRGYKDAPDFSPLFIGKMDEDHIHAVDSFCLHRTSPGGFRVSVDLRLVFEDKLPFDSEGHRFKNYV